MPQFDNILKAIDNAVNRFNRRIPSTQKDMLAAIEEDLRSLDVTDGKIKASVKNLSIIARIKNRMTKIILTDDYKKDVKEFAQSFNEVTALQNQYWKNVEATYKPSALLKEIKNITIEDTVNRLMDTGISANIADPIADILKTNITGGGSYRALTDQLKQALTDTDTKGLLSKYAKTLTVDSLNTYNAQYTQTVSSDLGFAWYKYDNSDIETTRPFCDAMTDVKYFHVSEIPALLRAEGLTYVNKKGERVAVPIYQRTGLPHGMKEGTNESNFLINRGGWNCGHQCRPVSDSLVPDDIKSRVYATPAYIRWAALQRSTGKIDTIASPTQTAPPPAVTKDVKSVSQALITKNKPALDSLKNANITQHAELLKYLPKDDITIVHSTTEEGSYYNSFTKELHLNSGNTQRLKNDYWRRRVMAHELGHVIHHENDIITLTKVRTDFVDLRNDLRKTLAGKLKDVDTALKAEMFKKGADVEQLVDIADVLGAISQGRYGWGHDKAYYNSYNRGDGELFTHAVVLSRIDNKYADITPEMKQVVDKMKAYILKTLEAIPQQP